MNAVLPFFQVILPLINGFDWGHFVAYFILAFTFLWAFDRPDPSLNMKLIVILLCVLYGLSDEFHQTFVKGRQSDILDLRNDTIGAVLAMIFVSIQPLKRLFSHLYKKVNRLGSPK